MFDLFKYHKKLIFICDTFLFLDMLEVYKHIDDRM